MRAWKIIDNYVRKHKCAHLRNEILIEFLALSEAVEAEIYSVKGSISVIAVRSLLLTDSVVSYLHENILKRHVVEAKTATFGLSIASGTIAGVLSTLVMAALYLSKDYMEGLLHSLLP